MGGRGKRKKRRKRSENSRKKVSKTPNGHGGLDRHKNQKKRDVGLRREGGTIWGEENENHASDERNTGFYLTRFDRKEN